MPPRARADGSEYESWCGTYRLRVRCLRGEERQRKKGWFVLTDSRKPLPLLPCGGVFAYLLAGQAGAGGGGGPKPGRRGGRRGGKGKKRPDDDEDTEDEDSTNEDDSVSCCRTEWSVHVVVHEEGFMIPTLVSTNTITQRSFKPAY